MHRTVGALTAAQFGEGSKKDGVEVSLLNAVGQRHAMDSKIEQVSFVSDKPFSDLDIYLENPRAKLTTASSD